MTGSSTVRAFLAIVHGFVDLTCRFLEAFRGFLAEKFDGSNDEYRDEGNQEDVFRHGLPGGAGSTNFHGNSLRRSSEGESKEFEEQGKVAFHLGFEADGNTPKRQEHPCGCDEKLHRGLPLRGDAFEKKNAGMFHDFWFKYTEPKNRHK